jgi:hypothetical protein
MDVDVQVAHVWYETIRIKDAISLEQAERAALERARERKGGDDRRFGSRELLVQWSTPVGWEGWPDEPEEDEEDE